MKRILSIFLFTLFAWGLFTKAYAQTAPTAYSSTYAISPRGNYDYLRLLPRPEIAAVGTACSPEEEGTFYSNKNRQGLLTYCGEGLWKVFGDTVWEFSGNILSPSLADDPGTLRVGVGTMTPEFKLTLDGDSGIFAQGTFGSGVTLSNNMGGAKFIWYPRRAAFWAGSYPIVFNDSNLGDSCDPGNYSVSFGFGMYPCAWGTGFGYSENGCQVGAYATVGGGSDTCALRAFATILGGASGRAGNAGTGHWSFVGANGQALGEQAASFSHKGNATYAAKGVYSFIGGGMNNNVAGDTSAIGAYSAIGGGYAHSITLDESSFNFIGGGYDHRIRSNYNVILGGGYANSTSGHRIEFGGHSNSYNTIGGGKDCHVLYAGHSTILGGGENSFVGNPGDDRAVDGAFLGGGNNNQSIAQDSTVVSGNSNVAAGDHSFIGAGINGRLPAAADFAAIGAVEETEGQDTGGLYSFVGGGRNNRARGDYSVVLGGDGNEALGDISFAGGRNMRLDAAADRSFVWGNKASPTTISAPNAFVVLSDLFSIGGPHGAIPSSSVRLWVDGDIRIDNGTIRLYGTVAWAGNSQLKYEATGRVVRSLDIAETFETTERVSAGDVLVLDPRHSPKLKKSRKPYEASVIGIVSTSPAILLEEQARRFTPDPSSVKKPKQPPVALVGRVPIKVCLENGPIQAGDLLTTSSRAGFAMKLIDITRGRHAVVGKALEPFSGGPKGKKTGMIEAVVMTR